MLNQVITSWSNAFKQLKPEWGVLQNKSVIDKNIANRTIYIYPDGAESFVGPKTVGNNPSQLRSRMASLYVDIYAKNLDDMDMAINDAIVAMEAAVRSPQMIVAGGEWLYEGEYLEHGYGYRLTFNISVVIARPHLRETTLTTEINTIAYDPNTVAH